MTTTPSKEIIATREGSTFTFTFEDGRPANELSEDEQLKALIASIKTVDDLAAVLSF